MYNVLLVEDDIQIREVIGDFFARRDEIRLELMALFDGQLPTQEEFTLRVEDNGTTYHYENCRVTERKTVLKGNQKAVEVFTLEADQMRKAVTDDE